MLVTSSRFFILIALVFAWGTIQDAHAHRRRWVRSGPTHVDVPGARVHVDGNGTSVRAPFVSVDPDGSVRVGIGQGLRRPIYRPDPPAVVQPVRPTVEVFPSVEQLAAMDDTQVLNAVLGLSQSLNTRLAQFDKGTRWQKHLALPADAFPPQAEDGTIDLGMQSIHETLVRFDKIASNPKVTTISRLPSFVAMHAALIEVDTRFGQAQKPQAPAEEVLPPPSSSGALVPDLAPPPAGQRSIMLKNQ